LFRRKGAYGRAIHHAGTTPLAETLLVTAMARQGFVNYAKEWWHFSVPGAAGLAYDFPIISPRK